MHALIENGQVAKYPFTQADLQAKYPGASIPAQWSAEFMAAEGIVTVVAVGQPSYNKLTHKAVDALPAYNAARSRWEQGFALEPLSAEEAAAAAQQLQDDIVAQTQARLDAFAGTRNYDGILSACTYATSTNPKFQAEGQYCVEARDATWARLYELLAEVEAGTRPVPSGYEDVGPELPVLAWPQ